MNMDTKHTELILRHASMDDAQILFDWRNDPGTRSSSLNHGEVGWDGHLVWLSRSLEKSDRILCVALVSGNPVGTVRADKNSDDSYEISYTIAPSSRGKGIGKRMVLQFVEEMLAGRRVTANIRRGHGASESIARALGLNPTEIERRPPGDEPNDQPIVEWR